MKRIDLSMPADAPSFLQRLQRPLWSLIQLAAIVVAIALAVGWNITPLRNLLVAWKILTADSSVSVVAALVAIVLGAAQVVQGKVDSLVAKLDRANADRHGDTLKIGTGEIFDEVAPKLRKRRILKQIEIDVLGFTLFSIKTRLRAWHESGALRAMRINLYCLDPAFVRSCPSIRQTWAADSDTNQKEVMQFIADNATMLRKQNVEIRVRQYRHLPAVHGFRIGTDTMYISVSRWSGSVLAEADESTFERVSASDASPYARALWRLFDSWVNAAEHSTEVSKAEREGKARQEVGVSSDTTPAS